MLSDSELAVMRQVAISALPNTATIIRTQRVNDLEGGYTTDDTIIGQNVPCRIDEDTEGRSGVEAGGQTASTGEMLVRLPHGTGAKEGDLIKVYVNTNVRRFKVARVVETSFATVRTLACTEVRS